MTEYKKFFAVLFLILSSFGIGMMFADLTNFDVVNKQTFDVGPFYYHIEEPKSIEEDAIETQVFIEKAKASLCSESPTCVDDLLNDQSWLDKVLVEKAKGKTFKELDFTGRGMVHYLALESCYVEECLQEIEK